MDKRQPPTDYQPEGKLLYRGKRVTLIQPPEMNGHLPREVVVHPGAVLILPLLNEKEIIFIQNQRRAVGKLLWELPAGTREEQEPPEETASRELTEETGYQANSIEWMMSFYTSPGFCSERMDLYLAKDLTWKGQRLDEGEEIIVQPVALEQAFRMIETGEILDGKTILALLYYEKFFKASTF